MVPSSTLGNQNPSPWICSGTQRAAIGAGFSLGRSHMLKASRTQRVAPTRVSDLPTQHHPNSNSSAPTIPYHNSKSPTKLCKTPFWSSPRAATASKPTDLLGSLPTHLFGLAEDLLHKDEVVAGVSAHQLLQAPAVQAQPGCREDRGTVTQPRSRMLQEGPTTGRGQGEGVCHLRQITVEEKTSCPRSGQMQSHQMVLISAASLCTRAPSCSRSRSPMHLARLDASPLGRLGS